MVPGIANRLTMLAGSLHCELVLPSVILFALLSDSVDILMVFKRWFDGDRRSSNGDKGFIRDVQKISIFNGDRLSLSALLASLQATLWNI